MCSCVGAAEASLVTCVFVCVCVCGTLSVCGCGNLSVCGCGYLSVCGCGDLSVCVCGRRADRGQKSLPGSHSCSKLHCTTVIRVVNFIASTLYTKIILVVNFAAPPPRAGRGQKSLPGSRGKASATARVNALLFHRKSTCIAFSIDPLGCTAHSTLNRPSTIRVYVNPKP